MFSVFSQTRAPTKRGPTKAHFFHFFATRWQARNIEIMIREWRKRFCVASNCPTAAAAIVVCIAARVLNKMSMMTSPTVRDRWRQLRGHLYNRGLHIFFWTGAPLGVNPALHSRYIIMQLFYLYFAYTMRLGQYLNALRCMHVGLFMLFTPINRVEHVFLCWGVRITIVTVIHTRSQGVEWV